MRTESHERHNALISKPWAFPVAPIRSMTVYRIEGREGFWIIGAGWEEIEAFCVDRKQVEGMREYKDLDALIEHFAEKERNKWNVFHSTFEYSETARKLQLEITNKLLNGESAKWTVQYKNK
jgi:hypothetical protein